MKTTVKKEKQVKNEKLVIIKETLAKTRGTTSEKKKSGNTNEKKRKNDRNKREN